MPRPDFIFTNHGSLWLCACTNDAAAKHLDAHLGEEAQRWGSGVAVEPRYVEQLAQALDRDGFTHNLNC